MATFLEALHSNRTLLMDGAMGTELQRAGMQQDECHELWNLTHPERVLAIHQAYVNASADCLLTNTFQANEAALARHGLSDKLEAIIRAALDLARAAAGPARFVVGDIGPIEHFTPEAVRRLIHAFRSADALLLETWSDAQSAKIFLQTARDTWSALQPVFLSFTYRCSDRSGDVRTFKGFTPATCAVAAKDAAVDALGVNCGRDLGMDDLTGIVRRYSAVTDLPLFARPNAGTPARVGDRWVYPHSAEDMAARLPELLDAGVTMVGGCCGTTPETIAAFRRVLDSPLVWPP